MCKVCDTGLPAYIVSFDVPAEVKAEVKADPNKRSISFVTLTLDEICAEAMVEAYKHRGIAAYVRPVRLGPKDVERLGELLAHATKWDTRDLVAPSKAVDP